MYIITIIIIIRYRYVHNTIIIKITLYIPIPYRYVHNTVIKMNNNNTMVSNVTCK